MEASTSVTEHLAAAKLDIAAGDESLRSAAEHVAAAIELGASQRDVAATVGRSAAWVNRLLLWRTSGFTASGPFAADHKAKKQRDAFSQAKRSDPKLKSEARAKADQAKAEAAQAKAEAAKAKAEAAKAKHEAAEAKAKADAEHERRRSEEFWDKVRGTRRSPSGKASISTSDRDMLVKCLWLLSSDQDGEVLSAAHQAERIRCKLKTGWDELIVIASQINEKAAA
jgi:hypothetical protein